MDFTYPREIVCSGDCKYCVFYEDTECGDFVTAHLPDIIKDDVCLSPPGA